MATEFPAGENLCQFFFRPSWSKKEPAPAPPDYPSWTKLIDGEATTDNDGRFRIEGLVLGLKYFLNTKDGNAILQGYTAGDLRFEPGKVRDLGDLKDKPAEKREDN